MKIAIHPRKNSFSENWIKYCEQNNIGFKIVDCRANDILKQLDDCHGLLWHWGPEEEHFAVPLTIALEKKGIKVFPNFNTCWHFDNKIAEKYIIEACGINMVPTYIFYDKNTAKKWVMEAEFPVVFKLRNGASSINVKLVQKKSEAKRLIKKAFSSGFFPVSRLSIFKNQIWRFKLDKSIRRFLGIINGARILLFGINIENIKSKEKGYIYFQKYVEKNDFDTRLVVIGNRCFGIRRYNRKNDFRASGSGILKYEKELFSDLLISSAFEISKKLETQSLACDFIFDQNNKPLLIEISYGFVIGKAYESCHGYWTDDLVWHDKPVRPEKFIIEDFIQSII